ncbi:putative DNA helicase [Vibrio phage phiKT1028]|nr:putative DNA helicase [Vibrio phage phiKT1028]
MSTDLTDVAVNVLAKESFDDLLPIKQFERYQQQLGYKLSDDERYYAPLYPAFRDINFAHDTSKSQPIYLNDFDFCLEEDRERLEKLIRMDFDTDTFETTASCGCDKPLKGNHLIGSGRVCKNCGNQVERLVDTELTTKVWLRLPTGVHSFINPAFYRTFLQNIATASPKIEIITYIIDPSYRRKINSQSSEKLRDLQHHLKLLLNKLDLNEFVVHADAIMDHFLLGEGRKITALKNSDAKEILMGYMDFKDVVFTDYLPVPNKLSTVIEKSGKERYASSSQLKMDSTYMSIADTKDNTDLYQVNEFDIHESVNRVGKGIVALAQQNAQQMKDFLFPKPGAARKLVASGSLPLTGRSVITSKTGIHNPGMIEVPWIMALAQLEKHILSHLYRKGFSPTAALEKISRAAHYLDPDIDAFFHYHEERNDIVCKSGRMPSIQYLSRRTFFARIKRDLGDQSIGLPILSVSNFNADFDGDQMVLFFLPDLRSKAASYGAFGHQSVFDENKPFAISRHYKQPSTNLMNINNVMRKLEFK